MCDPGEKASWLYGSLLPELGPWDALIREGRSVVQLSLPLILGSDLAGFVDSVGAGVVQFKPGDEVSRHKQTILCAVMPNTRWRQPRW